MRFFKAHDWWASKPPILLAIAYYQFGAARHLPSFPTCLAAVALFLVACIGIAGFGYLLNDLSDAEQDRAAGARNLVTETTFRRRLVLFGISLLAAWLPWLLLPTRPYVLVLIVAEFALFGAYSVPPLRLKGRGILGVVADALYGYTVPVLVALEVFGLVAHTHASPTFTAIAVGWAFVVGCRHIITHQLDRLERDRRFRIGTLAVRLGWRTTSRALLHLVLPLEAALFCALLVGFGAQSLVVPAGFVAYAVWTLGFNHLISIDAPVNPFRSPPVDRLFTFDILLMSRFQTDWLPLLVLISLSVAHPAFLLLLTLHVILFPNGPRSVLVEDLPWLRRTVLSHVSAR